MQGVLCKTWEFKWLPLLCMFLWVYTTSGISGHTLHIKRSWLPAPQWYQLNERMHRNFVRILLFVPKISYNYCWLKGTKTRGKNSCFIMSLSMEIVMESPSGYVLSIWQSCFANGHQTRKSLFWWSNQLQHQTVIQISRHFRNLHIWSIIK